MSIAQNLLRLRTALKFTRALLFRRMILVFQMGKVGSLAALFAVQRSLEEQGRGYGKWNFREIGNTILVHSHVASEVRGGFYRSIILWRVRLGLPLKVICPIREPIARDVSGFFYFYCQKNPGILENTNLRELEELFLTDSRPRRYYPPFSSLPAEHEWTLNWFDEHLKPLLRIDVYKQPFPKDRKWQIYRRGFTWVLVYRIDLKRSEQTKLISRFLGIKLDEMRLQNDGDKDYTELYSQFRESVKLPERYIRRMHDSRFARHFWSPQELKTAADKWRVAPSS